MSFTLNRDGIIPIKKNVNINLSPNISNLSQNLGTTSNSNIVSVTSLSLNNIEIVTSASNLNKLEIIPGIAEKSKVLVLDNSRNISNINRLDCSTLIAGGQNISASLYTASQSDDINNPLLVDQILGIGTANKALIANNNQSIFNINKLSTKKLILKNTIVDNKNINIEIQNLKSINDKYLLIQTENSNYKLSTSIYTYSLNSSIVSNSSSINWSSITWSPELKLFVAISENMSSVTNSQGHDIYRIITSKNGLQWNFGTLDIYFWKKILWISKLKLFIAINSNGGLTNSIAISYDGYTWSYQSTSIIGQWIDIIWSDELNMCLCISNNTNNRNIIYSNDCKTWFTNSSSLVNSIGLKKICWSSKLNMFVAILTSASVNGFVVSNNGYNWTAIPSPNGSTTTWNCIQWSPYLEMFVACGNLPTNKKIFYSYNGYNWFEVLTSTISNLTVETLLWIDALKLWIGAGSGTIIYSSDSINWAILGSNIISSINHNDITWSDELNSLIIVNSASGTNSNDRFIVIQPSIIGKCPVSLFHKSIINENIENNTISINSNYSTSPIDINSNSGKILQLQARNNSSCTFEFLNNSLNISHPSIEFSINDFKLNNISLTSSFIDLWNNLESYYQNSNIEKNKIILLDNTRNISNINTISCNLLITNNVIRDTSLNNSYFQNTNPGVAISNKALITDYNNNIKELNQIENINYLIENDYLTANKNNKNINIDTYFKSLLYNTDYNNSYLPLKTSITLPQCTWTSVCWSSQLELFVAVSNAGTTTNRIIISSNGYNWSFINDINTQSVNFTSICWSDKLEMFVACSTTSGKAILYSYNGIIWYNIQNADLNSTWNDICWASELSLFVAVSTNGRVMLSSSGLNWYILPSAITSQLGKICWSPELKLFIAISTTSITDSIWISNDGYSWNISNSNILLTTTTLLRSISWSSELNMFIMITNNGEGIYYFSYDGMNWFNKNINKKAQTIQCRDIIWISDLKIFIIIGDNNTMAVSSNGIDWNLTQVNSPAAEQDIGLITWAPSLKKILLLTSSTTISRAYISLPISYNVNNSLTQQLNTFSINKTNGYIGLGGINASYQLHLANDSAAKLSSSTWTITSDIRLKDNIINADLELCMNTFKQCQLMKYKRKNNNNYQLGWIAQQIEPILPNSVYTHSYNNINDCKFLNVDQLNSLLFGTTQYLMTKYDVQDEELISCENILNELDLELHKLLNDYQ